MLLDEDATEDEIINQFVERKLNGEDASTLRRELISKGFTQEKIAFLMSEIDERVITSYQSKRSSLNPRMIAGVVLGVVSITLFLIGIRGILTIILIFTSLAMIAIRTPKSGGNIEKSKWSRH